MIVVRIRIPLFKSGLKNPPAEFGMKIAEETHHFFIVKTLVRIIKTLNNMVLQTLAMRDHHFPATVKIVHVDKGGKGLVGGLDIPSGVLTVWVTQILNLRLQRVVGCEVQKTSV